MVDDSIRKLLQGHQSLGTDLKRLRDAAGLSYAQNEMKRFLEEQSRIERTLGAVDAQRRMLESAGMASKLGFEGLLLSDLELARSSYESQFRIPAIADTRRLLGDLSRGPINDLLRVNDDLSSVQRAIESMQTPWLHESGALASAKAMTELIGIGQALKSIESFDATFSDALRLNLGDWRDTFQWSAETFTDSLKRLDFYVERGFDSSLTDFPDTTFEEGLELSGLNREPPNVISVYGAPIPPFESPEHEGAASRTNMAHDWLFRLETQLRHLIETAMSGHYGPDWARRKLPNEMYEQWLEKKERAESNGAGALPLIAYADFTDYEKIFCKRDNWREVFVHIFNRQESVRESLQRLYPIRICTMHARIVSQEDQLFLYVEVKRLNSAISNGLR